MLTNRDYLLTKLMEECGEIIQRAAKIQRFGLEEIQDGHSENNQQRLQAELTDLAGGV